MERLVSKVVPWGDFTGIVVADHGETCHVLVFDGDGAGRTEFNVKRADVEAAIERADNPDDLEMDSEHRE